VDEDGVLPVGPVPHSEVSEYLQACDVFVLPSYAEGVPVAMLEAMASGLPVVATSVGGIPEVVKDGEAGYLIPPRDTEGLLAAMEALAEDENVRRRMGRTGARVITERFHWHHGSRILIEKYQGLVSRSVSEISQ
jgi:glycosyltransferase involved in cell wall biosynthesis